MRTHIEGLAATSKAEQKKVAFHMILSSSARRSLGNSAPTLTMFIHHLRSMNHVVDYYFSRSKFVNALRSRDYDVAALSGVKKDLVDILKLALSAKRANPRIITGVGGFATATYGHLLPMHPAVDCAFFGESEYNFPLFLKFLSKHAGD